MPQVLSINSVLTRARLISAEYARPLRPFIFGPQAGLHRYNTAAEKAGIALGAYDRLADTVYDYPGKTDTSVVDLSYVKLYADGVKLKYFDRAAGSGVGGLVAIPTGHANRVRASALTFVSSTGADGTAYARSANFYDRDVAVGDLVYVRGVDGGTPYSLWTSVADFVHDQTTASVGAASAAASNAATQIASDSDQKLHGATLDNEVEITAVGGSSYDGSDDGDLTETYTVTVLEGSVGGDATTAVLRVVSASGNDDQAEVSPEAFGDPTPIGTRGLTVTWDLVAQAEVSESEIDQDDFVAGQQWSVTVAQAFTAPTATAAGTPAAGMPGTTYVVRVSRGGAYAGATKPQITVTTTTGVDLSGPTNVTAAATPVAVGNYGVTIAFNQTRLRKGDIYYVTTTAVQDGAVRTLVLNNSLPAELAGVSDLDLQLYIPKTGYLIPRDRETDVGAFNWTADADGVTVHDGITVYEPGWADGGTPLALPVTAATLYLEYREWLVDAAGAVGELSSLADVAAALGTVDPDNPLAYGVYQALQNTAYNVLGGSQSDYDRVLYASLGGDPADTTVWQDVLDLAYGREEVYNLVPLTDDAAVHDLCKAHVDLQSDADHGKYRAMIVPLAVATTAAVRDVDDADAVILATLTADPDDNTKITRLFNAAGTAGWKTAGVRAGDVVRYDYSDDGYGNPTWVEYVVSDVPAEDTIVIRDAGVTVPTAVAQRVEVWRNLTKADLSAALIARAAEFASDRVVGVWPDTYGFGGSTLPSYYLCAALAGLAGSVPPHQGLTNVELLGPDSISRSNRYFTGLQLEQLAAAGVLLIAQAVDGTVYVHKAVTTDPTSTATLEEMVRRDTDGVRHQLLNAWGAYYGHTNVSAAAMTRQLTDAFTTVIRELAVSTDLPALGPMAATGVINDIRPHATLPDKYLVDATISGPFPFNQALLTVTRG